MVSLGSLTAGVSLLLCLFNETLANQQHPTRWANEQYLDSIGASSNNLDLFEYAMDILDSNFGLPFLFQTPKLSSWYVVGLLARAQGNDVEVANKLIANIVTQQYTDPSFIGYGTFKDGYLKPYVDVSDTLWPPKIYNSYDPNVNLFVTIAGIIIDSQFSHLLWDSNLANLRKAMYIATVGDGYRVGGLDGDNLYPDYSNPWYMRCVSAAYVGNMCGDSNMTYWANEWAKEGIELFNMTNTLSEFNGGTYAGVTLFALSLAQYCPTNSTIYQQAPRVITSVWDQLAETYNPSLTTLSGPWDRTYGFDLTQYYGIIGSGITGIIGMNGSYPMPNPLDGSNHYTDMAIIPMQVVTSVYTESLIPSQAKSRFAALYAPHMYDTQAFSPPWDKRPRNYTFWVDDGLSVGGIEFDESEVGGPSINQGSFSPGVILWDAGKGGAGAGWISYWPTSPSCSIVATPSNLTIRYPPSQDWPNSTVSTAISLLLSPLPDWQLGTGSFNNSDHSASFPGLNVSLSGNAVDQGQRILEFTGDEINGFRYYNLTYDFAGGVGNEVPELVVAFTKTTPPQIDLYVE
ncbi:hypothetical protein BD324DRAFT_678482 [Kockovaella imperatae]|uniref:Uncharacterized protein n=1 Tax=Kockovaella imperatae TaxID=4999 RepID=A0A1Y1USU4_9TREE|nr:hypothetical protein BD324DRAFT_678482 [Kockovaella imperatae]ORX41089.1 hypothetical protein BD324DRAFT_678482 [Kockovaella imperatae]